MVGWTWQRSWRAVPWLLAGFCLAAAIAGHLEHMPRLPRGWNDSYVYAGAASNFIDHPSALYVAAVHQVASATAIRAYIYPPSGLIPFLPLVPVTRSFGIATAASLWSVADTAALVGALIVLARQCRLSMPRTGVLALLLAVSVPAAWEISSGQVNGVVLLLIALALRAHPRPRSGVLLGLGLALKPVAPLLLLVPLLRGQWKLAAVAASTLLAVNLAFVPWLGLGALRFYVTSFLPFMAGFNAHDPANVSVANVVLTWVGGRTAGPTLTSAVSPLHLLGLATALVWMLRIGVLVALVRAIRRRGHTDMEMYALALATVPLYSSTVWMHYFLYALPLLVLVLARATSKQRLLIWMGVAAAVWAGVPEPFWSGNGGHLLHNGVLNYLQSELLGVSLTLAVVAMLLGSVLPSGRLRLPSARLLSPRLAGYDRTRPLRRRRWWVPERASRRRATRVGAQGEPRAEGRGGQAKRPLRPRTAAG